MTYNQLIIDSSTGEATVQELTPNESADLESARAQIAQRNAALQARASARAAAINKLKAKAAAGDTTSTLVLQAMDIDPNAPDPTKPSAG